jgi:hypothetical protein
MSIQSLEDLKVALEKNENGSDILAFVEQAIGTERQRGETEKSQANSEARNRREQVKKLKAVLAKLGYQEGEDVDTFAETLSEKLGSAHQGVTPSGEESDVAKELAKLRRDFDKTRKELEKERQASSEIKAKAAQKTIRSKLADALRDKVLAHDLLADSLISKGQVKLDDDDESVVFIDGEDTVDFDTGVKKLLESRSDILRNQQTPGSRTTARNAGPTGAKYSRQQLESMSQAEIAADRQGVYASWNAIRAAEAVPTT